MSRTPKAILLTVGIVLIAVFTGAAVAADPQDFARFPGPQLTDSQMPKGW